MTLAIKKSVWEWLIKFYVLMIQTYSVYNLLVMGYQAYAILTCLHIIHFNIQVQIAIKGHW